MRMVKSTDLHKHDTNVASDSHVLEALLLASVDQNDTCVIYTAKHAVQLYCQIAYSH
jgi:hypothetical protein